VSAGNVAVRKRASDRTAGPWAVLVFVCFAQFMVVLDATIVNVALPSVESGLSLSASNLQWVINAYTLTLGGFFLLGGRAGGPASSGCKFADRGGGRAYGFRIRVRGAAAFRAR